MTNNKMDGQDAPAIESAQFRKRNRDEAEAKRKEVEAERKQEEAEAEAERERAAAQAREAEEAAKRIAEDNLIPYDIQKSDHPN